MPSLVSISLNIFIRKIRVLKSLLAVTSLLLTIKSFPRFYYGQLAREPVNTFCVNILAVCYGHFLWSPKCLYLRGLTVPRNYRYSQTTLLTIVLNCFKHSWLIFLFQLDRWRGGCAHSWQLQFAQEWDFLSFDENVKTTKFLDVSCSQAKQQQRNVKKSVLQLGLKKLLYFTVLVAFAA